jgi:hypothetical protein
VAANNVHATSSSTRIKDEEGDLTTLQLFPNESLLLQKPQESEQDTTEASSFNDSFQSNTSVESFPVACTTTSDEQQRHKLGSRTKEKILAGLQRLATPMIMRKRKAVIVKVDAAVSPL